MRTLRKQRSVCMAHGDVGPHLGPVHLVWLSSLLMAIIAITYHHPALPARALMLQGLPTVMAEPLASRDSLSVGLRRARGGGRAQDGWGGRAEGRWFCLLLHRDPA